MRTYLNASLHVRQENKSFLVSRLSTLHVAWPSDSQKHGIRRSGVVVVTGAVQKEVCSPT